MNIRKVSVLALAIVLQLSAASAFCGFYVAKAGAELFNNRSQIILVRDGKRTVITMSNDFKGNVRDFAMVVPVPEVLKKDQVKTVDAGVFARLDAYSGPRLVEYYDPNPCAPIVDFEHDMVYESVIATNAVTTRERVKRKDYKVTIEEQYSVGEYDILVLSAKESEGLKNWLTDNDYKIPEKAERVLEPYIKSDMKFFVVKVNLDRAAASKNGYVELSPIQISFKSERFMLPLRLGMANSTGEQDMIVYAFTKSGRVEAANYRTVKVPTARKIPTFVKSKFGLFYKDLFDKQYKREGKNAVFLEYAWNVSPAWSGAKCDPCVGMPPQFKDFAIAGVDWINDNNFRSQNVFFTRLHVRYSEARFPEDLFFMVTPNTEQFQGRYILTHPATGPLDCEEAGPYKEELSIRRKQELMELAALTDWNVDVYSKYISEGSGEEKIRKETAPVIPGGTTPRGPNLPVWLFILGFVGAVFFMFLRYPAVKT